MSDEVNLASNVILQALADGCAPITGDRPTAGNATHTDRYEAWVFLTALRGPWARSRHDWATTAGLDPDSIRLRAVARGPHPYLARDTEKEAAA